MKVVTVTLEVGKKKKCINFMPEDGTITRQALRIAMELFEKEIS